jgi:hypothetical protein
LGSHGLFAFASGLGAKALLKDVRTLRLALLVIINGFLALVALSAIVGILFGHPGP